MTDYNRDRDRNRNDDNDQPSIPEGNFIAKGIGYEFGLTRDAKPQVLVNCEIIEGTYAGQTLPWFGYFSQDTEMRTLEALRYLGWQSDDLADMRGFGKTTVQIVVEHEKQMQGKNAGKTFARVRWINRPGAGGIKLAKPMDAADLRRFGAKMRGLAKSVPVVPLEQDASSPRREEPRREEPRRAEHTTTTNGWGNRDRNAGRNDDRPPPSDDEIPF